MSSRLTRLVTLVGLVLFVVVPAAVAGVVSWWQQRQLRGRYRYAPHSYATSYPQPPELYLEESWRMRTDGSFAEPVIHSAGLYVKASDFDVLELLHEDQPPQEAPRPNRNRTSEHHQIANHSEEEGMYVDPNQ